MDDFRRVFEGCARALARRARLRAALDVGAVAALATAVMALGVWAVAPSPPSLWPLASFVPIAAIGAALLFRRAAPIDAALLLDARARADDRVVAAFEAAWSTDADGDRVDAKHAVVERGRALLAARGAELSRTPVGRPLHLAMALLVVPVILSPVSRLVLARADLLGAARAQRAHADSLAFAIQAVPARDDAERARLDALAERARRAAAADPVDREALGAVRDELGAMLEGRSDAEARAKMRAALDASAEPSLAAALERGPAAVDAEVERLAASDEERARAAARETLARLSEIAKSHGEERWEKFFREEQRRLAEAIEKADALRELAKALRDGNERAPGADDGFDPVDPREQRRAIEEMTRALEGMTPEERKRLAERLAAAADARGAPQGSAERKFAERVGEGDASTLGDALRELARAPEASGEAEGERGGQGASDALGRVLGLGASGAGAPGAGPGVGPKTPNEGPIPDASSLPSRADVPLQAGPTGRTITRRQRAEAGGTARPVDGVPANTPSERVLGVNGTEVPARYRDQLDRYFSR